jgi:hypothetical protein
MINMTWSNAPADLLGLGGLDVRPVHGSGLCRYERVVSPIPTPQGTGLSAVGTATRLRPVTRQAFGHDVVTTKSFENNGTSFENNGTTLGNHSSRRPQS